MIHDYDAFRELMAEHDSTRPVELRPGEILDITTALQIAEAAVEAINGDADSKRYLRERLTRDPHGYIKGEVKGWRELADRLDAEEGPHADRRAALGRRIGGR
jgi:hypothetical protein